MQARYQQEYLQNKASNLSNGTLYVFSGPSGVGKTTIMNRLSTEVPNLKKIVGYTTREIRPGEVKDETYHYISTSEFQIKAANNDFLEHIQFSGNYYGFGLSKDEVNAELNSGNDLMVDMDYSQVSDLKTKILNTKSIFILPPSIDSLKSRLEHRNEKAKIIENRMKYAQRMIDNAYQFDYIVKNENGKLNKTLYTIKKIIFAERSKSICHRVLKHLSFFTKMENNSIIEHRHQHPALQREYDKRFGVIPYSPPLPKPILLVGIVGISGSGKTTLANNIVKKLRESNTDVAYLRADHYYKDMSHLSAKEFDEYNFDIPAAVDMNALYSDLNKLFLGHRIPRKKYLYAESTGEDKTTFIEPAKVVIVEGMFLLIDKRIRQLFTDLFLVDVSLDKAFARRLMRDIQNIGNCDKALRYYESQLRPAAFENILDLKEYTNYILSNESLQDQQKSIQLATSIIHNKLQSLEEAASYDYKSRMMLR